MGMASRGLSGGYPQVRNNQIQLLILHGNAMNLQCCRNNSVRLHRAPGAMLGPR